MIKSLTLVSMNAKTCGNVNEIKTQKILPFPLSFIPASRQEKGRRGEGRGGSEEGWRIG